MQIKAVGEINLLQVIFPFFESRVVSKKEALERLHTVSKTINVILADEELLCNPKGFEREVLRELEKLRGLKQETRDKTLYNSSFMVCCDAAHHEGYMKAVRC